MPPHVRSLAVRSPSFLFARVSSFVVSCSYHLPVLTRVQCLVITLPCSVFVSLFCVLQHVLCHATVVLFPMVYPYASHPANSGHFCLVVGHVFASRCRVSCIYDLFPSSLFCIVCVVFLSNLSSYSFCSRCVCSCAHVFVGVRPVIRFSSRPGPSAILRSAPPSRRANPRSSLGRRAGVARAREGGASSCPLPPCARPQAGRRHRTSRSSQHTSHHGSAAASQGELAAMGRGKPTRSSNSPSCR